MAKRNVSNIPTLVAALLVAMGGPCLAEETMCETGPAATPAGILELVYARPFILDKGYRSSWRKEHPLVRSGYIVVLRVDPGFVAPRTTEEPVLYAGDQTVERINIGESSGHVIGIVPGKGGLKGMRFWFGEPGFPGSVDALAIERSRKAAVNAGLGVIHDDQVARARAAGGSRLHVAGKSDLLMAISPLILEYSPQEQSLANILQGRPPGD